MVQINPLLYAIPVLSQFAPLDSTPNGLAVRQTFVPSSLPSACQSPCQVVNTMVNCAAISSLSCMCANTIGSQLQECMNCIVNASLASPAVQSAAQAAISNWNQACDGDFTLSGGSSSGGTTSGTTGGTTAGITGGITTGTIPTTTTSTSPSGGSSANPLAATSGGVGLKTSSGMAVCIVAVLVGAFMSL